MVDEILAGGQGPGGLLRAARERRGMSLRDVADGLNLKQRTVEALEAEHYDQLPPHTFVKGYYKSYANLVGVKEYDILAALDRQLPEERPEPLRAGAAREPGAGGRMKWLLLAVVIALAVFYLYPRQEPVQQAEPATEESAQQTEGEGLAARDDSSPVTLAPPGETESARSPAPLAEAEPEQSSVAAAETEPEQSPVAAVEPESEPPLLDQAPQAVPEVVDSAVEPDLAEPPVTEPGPPALALDVRGESWLEVRDGDGRELFSGVARGPRRLEFAGAPPYSLVVGDYAEVEVRYGGESVSLAAHTRGKVARLSVPAQ